MRRIWSEKNKRILMRQVWVALVSAQNNDGLVTADQLVDLKSKVKNLDIDRSLEIEREIHHDVMADLRTYADQCPNGVLYYTWARPAWTSPILSTFCEYGKLQRSLSKGYRDC